MIKGISYPALISVAKELNKKLGLKPEINLKWNMDNLIRRILEVWDKLLDPDDKISKSTRQTIADLKKQIKHKKEQKENPGLEEFKLMQAVKHLALFEECMGKIEDLASGNVMNMLFIMREEYNHLTRNDPAYHSAKQILDSIRKIKFLDHEIEDSDESLDDEGSGTNFDF